MDHFHQHDHHHHHDHGHRDHHPNRRHFLASLLGVGLAGASLFEIGLVRAVLARVQSRGASTKLFDIQKVGEDVYCAVARPAAMVNCNASIFVNARDILIVDTHSKPSAAAALIAQIREEVTEKPVRFIVNTHFHWDHSWGNSAYRDTFPDADILASEPTSQLMKKYAESRLRDRLDQIPEMLEQAEKNKERSRSAEERAFYEEEIRQIKAFDAEMRRFSLEIPTVTFEDSHIIEDDNHDLRLSFHGRGHTAGDVVVFCPEKGLVATGDLAHGFFPFIGDGYPREWPETIEAVSKLDFFRILPGHGPVQWDRTRVKNFQNYLEELTERVARGKSEGKSVGELQNSISVSSLRSLGSNQYGDFLARNIREYRWHWGSNVNLQESVNTNIEHIYQNLER